MKECRAHREVMSSYLDSAASPAERAALEAHLAQCPECQTALEELRWTTRQIRGLEPVEPPPWMTAKIMARLREGEAPSVSIWRRYFFPILASAQFRVATLVLVGAAGYYIVSRSTGVPQVAREARQAPEPRESAPPDQKAFAPPPPARPAAQKQKKDAAPAPAPRAASAPGLDKRKSVPPPSADAAAPAAESEMTPRVASADFAAPAIAAAPPTRLSQAAPAPGAAAGTLHAREAAKAERAAPATVIRPLIIRIDPFDPAGISALVERELGRARADVVTPPVKTDGRSLTARLDSRRLPELLERLARIGSVRERPESLEDLPSVVTVTIRW
jgi:hypothetical protein